MVLTAPTKKRTMSELTSIGIPIGLAFFKFDVVCVYILVSVFFLLLFFKLHAYLLDMCSVLHVYYSYYAYCFDSLCKSVSFSSFIFLSLILSPLLLYSFPSMYCKFYSHWKCSRVCVCVCVKRDSGLSG